MMIPRRYLFWIVLLIVFVILAGMPGATPQAAGQVTAAPTAAATTSAITITFGPGSFNLQPTAGLADLSGYQATFNLDFKGKEGGQDNPWTEKLVLLANAKPAVRALTATFKGKAPAADYIAPWSATKGGLFYYVGADKECVGNILVADANPNAPPPVWEPASFLPAVIGAEEAGAKKVNNVDAKGYKFDERALGVAGRAKATGEVWVAATGGYVLKYNLTLTAGPDYFGEGDEGTLTWAYDVTKAGQPAAITFPKDCPSGLIDAPVMDDAQDVQRLPGITLYNTKSTPAQVADFYQKKLTEAGWKVNGKPAITEQTAMLTFKQGTEQLTVVVKVTDKGTRVRLLL
jgi:hypothetical protein